MEVSKLLPLLTKVDPQKPSFHVVTFSLPGFGFSEAPKQKGFSGAKYAEVRIVPRARISYLVHPLIFAVSKQIDARVGLQ